MSDAGWAVLAGRPIPQPDRHVALQVRRRRVQVLRRAAPADGPVAARGAVRAPGTNGEPLAGPTSSEVGSSKSELRIPAQPRRFPGALSRGRPDAADAVAPLVLCRRLQLPASG